MRVSVWWVLTAGDWQSDSGLSDRSPSGPSWASTHSTRFTHKLRRLQVWPKKKNLFAANLFWTVLSDAFNSHLQEEKKVEPDATLRSSKRESSSEFSPQSLSRRGDDRRVKLSGDIYPSAVITRQGMKGRGPLRRPISVEHAQPSARGGEEWVVGADFFYLLLSSVLIGHWQM